MNRLHHIRKTLPVNIKSNRDYPNIEFAILDYNSNDGLEDWINETYQDELRRGRLVFRRTNEPTKFLWSHSKNMAISEATGDIVCNVDADNFTGHGFASYLNEHFLLNPESYLSVNYKDSINQLSDTYGRIACFKKDFDSLGGYDERMQYYGYEDNDFCERLKRFGKKQHFIQNKKYLHAIRHDSSDRYSNNTKSVHIKSIYIHYISPLISKIIYLFINGNCLHGTIEDLNRGLGTATLKEGQWTHGKYHLGNGGNKLNILKGKNPFQFQRNRDHLIDDNHQIYYIITDEKFLIHLELQYGIIANHQILTDNMEKGRIKVNIKSI